jgi:hypothetical protein
MLSIVLYMILGIIIVIDMKTRFPEEHNRLGGMSIFFNPFKQLDFLRFLFSRKYTAQGSSSLHKYDLFILNFIVLVVTVFFL